MKEDADIEVRMKDGSIYIVTEAELMMMLDPESYRMVWCDGCQATIPWGHHYCEQEAGWDGF